MIYGNESRRLRFKRFRNLRSHFRHLTEFGLAYLQFGALIDYLTAFFLDINTAALQISVDVDNEHLGI